MENSYMAKYKPGARVRVWLEVYIKGEFNWKVRYIEVRYKQSRPVTPSPEEPCPRRKRKKKTRKIHSEETKGIYNAKNNNYKKSWLDKEGGKEKERKKKLYPLLIKSKNTINK